VEAAMNAITYTPSSVIEDAGSGKLIFNFDVHTTYGMQMHIWAQRSGLSVEQWHWTMVVYNYFGVLELIPIYI
jgi:hypothetical protein